MILQSDIIRLGFVPKPEESKGPYLKLSSASVNRYQLPNFVIELSDSTTQWKQMVIHKINDKDEGAYEVIFKGDINSPADLLRLFKMLKIPLPKNIS